MWLSCHSDKTIRLCVTPSGDFSFSVHIILLLNIEQEGLKSGSQRTKSIMCRACTYHVKYVVSHFLCFNFGGVKSMHPRGFFCDDDIVRSVVKRRQWCNEFCDCSYENLLRFFTLLVYSTCRVKFAPSTPVWFSEAHLINKSRSKGINVANAMQIFICKNWLKLATLEDSACFYCTSNMQRGCEEKIKAWCKKYASDDDAADFFIVSSAPFWTSGRLM